MKKLVSIVCAGLVLTGCATEPVLKPSADFAPTLPVAEPPRAATGAIFYGAGDDWFGRKRHYRVGDVLTVLLNESTQANRTQSTNTARESTNNVLAGSVAQGLLPRGGALAGLKLDGGTIESKGTGTADQRATLTGSITVTISEVLPNGNLVIRGEKQLALSEGSEFIQVAGIVRPQDVAPDGTVQSRRLANAQIAYRGTGELANASKAGWGSKLLFGWWPF
jgi:flagellar L-ring protein precursor FlgH